MTDREINTNSVFILVSGFVLGILVSSFIFVSPLSSALVTTTGAVVLIAEKIRHKKINKEVLFLALALLSFGLGALRYSIKDFHEPLLPEFSGGIVINEPEQRENTTRFVLRTNNGEKVLVSTDLYSPVQYGDRVTVEGKLDEPGIIDDDAGRSFDYAAYLSKDDIYYTLNFAKVEVLSGGHGNPVRQLLFKIKRNFVKKIKEVLTEPHASLLSGLIISGKEALPKKILEEFRRAGVIHVVVLSGYNITIIAEFVKIVFRSASFSIIGIILFVIMTGAQATVVRAALMVLAVILAKKLGRNFSAPRALLVAAFLMLLHNPKILVFDPSFQLSFLATCGLIFVTPLMEKYLNHIPEKWGIRTIVSTTLATQITVLPLLIYSMGDVSTVSLPANILILLVIPYAMLVGSIAATIAYLSPIIALPFSYISYILLAWILGVSHYLGKLSFASVTVPLAPWWTVTSVYLAIIIFVWRQRNVVPRSAN